MKPLFPTSILLLISLIFSGIPACGFKKVASKTTADVFYDASPTIDREDDVELAEQASLGFLKMLEGFYLQNPKDKVTLLLLTRSYAGYAFGFTENEILASKGSQPAAHDKAVARAKRFYGRAKQYAMELLDRYPAMAKAQQGTLEEFTAALQEFKLKDVENLFWIGFAWGNFLNYNKDSVEAIAELPRVEAVMKRVLELDPRYYYGGADLFFGVLYGNRPKLLGGDPTKSKEFFEKAVAVSDGKNLMAPVLMAQFYAVQIQDSKLYKKLLNDALAADAAALPEQRLMNELAKIRAQILLNKKAQYFTQAS
jgi:hypothetical protein